MSNYRDDTTDTVIVSDLVWVNTSSLMSDNARVSDSLPFGLSVLLSDSATVSDEVSGGAQHVLTDTMIITDSNIGIMGAKALLTDTAKASEKLLTNIISTLTDSLTVSDNVFDSDVSAILTDSVNVSDDLITSRNTRYMLNDAAKVSDSAGLWAIETLTDTASLRDAPTGKLTANSLLDDSAVVVDSIFGQTYSNIPLTDTAIAVDSVFGAQAAQALLNEWIVIEDVLLGQDGAIETHSQAWSANTGNWAMSRYAPYTFDSIAVVDGVMYGSNSRGVYRLDADGEQITGSITTGKIDISGGSLSYPTEAYLEYELSGQTRSAVMAVTSTQKGRNETYKYRLASERADELTNGRFVFGRGLRGRHFAYQLTMTANRGYINDLTINVAKGNRRI